jgi:hypothetical protein
LRIKEEEKHLTLHERDDDDDDDDDVSYVDTSLCLTLKD